MRTARDLTGEKFNKLTVIKYSHSEKGNSKWWCICECGTEKIICRSRLVTGITKTCGCAKGKVNIKANNAHAKNQVYNAFIQRCKRRGMELEFSQEELLEIITKVCFYCSLSSSNYCKRKHSEFRFNGLDRINNSKGYSKENTVPCCKYCNALRMDILTVDETLKIIQDLRISRGISGSPWNPEEIEKQRKFNTVTRGSV